MKSSIKSSTSSKGEQKTFAARGSEYKIYWIWCCLLSDVNKNIYDNMLPSSDNEFLPSMRSNPSQSDSVSEEMASQLSHRFVSWWVEVSLSSERLDPSDSCRYS